MLRRRKFFHHWHFFATIIIASLRLFWWLWSCAISWMEFTSQLLQFWKSRGMLAMVFTSIRFLASKIIFTWLYSFLTPYFFHFHLSLNKIVWIRKNKNLQYCGLKIYIVHLHNSFLVILISNDQYANYFILNAFHKVSSLVIDFECSSGCRS